MEVLSRAAFVPAFVDDPELRVLAATRQAAPFVRWLYKAVGWAVQWDERAAWTDAAWIEHMAHPSVTVLVLFRRDTPIGFVELNSASSEPGTEIAYLGMLPSQQGRGLGKHLLSIGVTHAFAAGASRIWLHTDNFDSPHAMANYRARGFVIYRNTTHEERGYPPGKVPAPPAAALALPSLPANAFAPASRAVP
jgi:ribosomal protein S18 acetylase RimI-like enzyme